VRLTPPIGPFFRSPRFRLISYFHIPVSNFLSVNRDEFDAKREKEYYCDMSTHCWVTQQSAARWPTGKQDFRADAMTSCNSIGIRFLRNMPRWHHPARGVREYRVTFAFPQVTQRSSHLARCCSDACTIEGYIRGTGMSTSQSEVNSRSQISARVLRRRYRSRLAVWIEDFACATVCDNLWKWPIAEKSATEDVLSKLGDFMCYSAVKIRM
jgi:hypothetical protein